MKAILAPDLAQVFYGHDRARHVVGGDIACAVADQRQIHGHTGILRLEDLGQSGLVERERKRNDAGKAVALCEFYIGCVCSPLPARRREVEDVVTRGTSSFPDAVEDVVVERVMEALTLRDARCQADHLSLCCVAQRWSPADTRQRARTLAQLDSDGPVFDQGFDDLARVELIVPDAHSADIG